MNHHRCCLDRNRALADPLQAAAVEDASNLPSEDVPHLLVCPHLAASRRAHRVDEYRTAAGPKYFYSLKFLRWLDSVFHGEYATPYDDPTEPTPGLSPVPSQNSVPEHSDDARMAESTLIRTFDEEFYDVLTAA